jgi:gamma-glutamyl-gamma-aminobutyrate hydrolase PuuD
MQVFIEHGNNQYRELFLSLGFGIASTVATANLVCFTGGSDVTPDMYGDKQHKYTGNDVYRDEKEKRLFEYCLNAGLPMVGICRG